LTFVLVFSTSPALDSAFNMSQNPFWNQNRIRMGHGSALPSQSQTLAAPSAGPPSVRPVNGVYYFGSADLGGGHIRPSKIHSWSNRPACRYGLNGREIAHPGAYTLLPYDANRMELIPAQCGEIPPGRRPVLGGYDEHGYPLYHCLVYCGVTGDESEVPGATSPEIGGGQAVTNNIVFTERNYSLLVWKDSSPAGCNQ